MCSLSKEQFILSRETIQNAVFSELCPIFDFDFLSSIKHPDFLSSIKHPTAECWHPYAVLLLSVRNIDQGQPAHSMQADMCQFFFSFCMPMDQVYLMILPVV